MSTSEEAPANVRVLVRVRPLNDREAKFNLASVLEIENGGMTSTIDFGMGGEPASATNSGGNGSSSEGTVSIVDHQFGPPGGYGSGYDSGANNAAATSTAAPRSFTYDAVFGPQSQQIEIFDSLKGIVDTVCAGYNGTIVAYGQTGSGKTHTIFGDEGLHDNNNAGLVQRSLKSIFRKIAEQSLLSAEQSLLGPTRAGAVVGESIRTSTKASFFEIYNERVYDLLSPNANTIDDEGKGLPVREDATKGVYVEGLIEREVATTMDAMDVLRCGMSNRKVAATKMNRVSSRSHAMFVLTVKSEHFSQNTVSKVRVSKFRMVDLAGSERQKATATDGERLKEASMINNSLLCLGQVINSLVDREKKGKERYHVPFRDSKLTFLLKDSFGGNSKTCLVATVTPSASSLTETISTLKFAQRAKLITNMAVKNENTRGSVPALQAEIARLRAELEVKNNSTAANNVDQVAEPGSVPLAPTKNKSDQSDSVPDVVVSALRSQNSKLIKKVKVLKDASGHREMQVNSLKRKLQQETLVRKCKERRITYLSSKGEPSGMEIDDEIASLRAEATILRQQLEAKPSDTVEWMLKYKDEKAKVEEMEADVTNTFQGEEKDGLEASLATLLDERDSLQQKVEDMSNERNLEIDSIIKDVNKLENANGVLQSHLDEKELAIMANDDKIQSNEAVIDELQESLTGTLDCLELAQSELAAEKVKAVELQDSVDSIKMEVNEVNAAIIEHQGKVTDAEEELQKKTEEHNESTTALNTKIAVLQNDLDIAMGNNESRMKMLKEASDDLEAKKNQLKSFEQEKREALKQLNLSEGENNANFESFKLKEETSRADIEKAEATIKSLLAEKTQATAALEKVTAQNVSLLGEVETLKLDRDALQQRVESLDKLHDHAASLEDEVMFVTIEKEQVETRLHFTEADLERTTRLQERLSATQNASHDDELALCDEIINTLSREKSKVQEEFTAVSRRLCENSAASDENIAMLQTDLGELADCVNSLEVDMKKAEKTSECLRYEKAQAAGQLEKVMAQRLTLVEKVEALRSNRDALQLTLDTKVTELQMDLAVATDNNMLLTKNLKVASDDLVAKKTQMESLESDKSEALTQLELTQEKSNADLELFKLHEETLKAEIKREVETVKYLQDKIAGGEAELNKITEEHSESTTVLNTKIVELQKGLAVSTDDNESLGKKLKDASNNIETKKTQLKSLEHDKSEALNQLSVSQEKNNSDLESFNLQEETLRTEIAKGEDAVKFIQDKADAAKEESKIMTREHNKSTTTLNAEITELQKGLSIAIDENGSLVKKVKDASDDLEAKQSQLGTLEHDKRETSKQLELTQEKSNFDREVFKFQEETLKSEIEKGEKAVEFLQGKVDDVQSELKKMTEEHNTYITVSSTKVTDMQKILDDATDDNAWRTKKLKNTLDDLATKTNQLESLEHDKSKALKQLELMQEWSNADAESFQLQEDTLRTEIAKGEDTVNSLQSKVDTAEEGLKKTNEEHKKSTITLNSKITELQKGLNVATDENESLMKKVKDASDDLKAKQSQLEILAHNKSEALRQLELTQAKSNADRESLKLQEESLKSDIEKGEKIAESLQGKVDAARAQLEEMTEEHNKSTTLLNSKVVDLQNDLDVATDSNELLTKKVNDAAKYLEAKTNELESLEHDKSEALKQIGLSQEKNNSEIESFKLNEETLRAEIKKAEETAASLLAEKIQATATVEQVTALHVSLSGEVEAVKVDRDSLQQHLVTFRGQIASLKDELHHITIEKGLVEEKLKSAEANPKRTGKLHQELIAAQKEMIAAETADVAHRDGVIHTLTEEKSSLEKELAEVSQKLVDNDTESNGKVEMLQNELVSTREEFNTMEHKEKQLRAELETTKMHCAKSVAYAAEQEEEFKTKMSEVESATVAIEKELGESQVFLAGNKGMKGELESQRLKVNELEGLVEQLREANNDSYAENIRDYAASNAELDALEIGRAHVESERDELKSNEEEMKAKIEALEKENATLRGEFCKNSPPSSDIPSPWNSPPIKDVDEPPQNTTFGADDTFDESMFLPNIDEQANVDKSIDIQEDRTNSPKTDENSKTPSKTPFKEKRALFSPAHTPATKMMKRTAQSMNRVRTPLGNSSIHNTPSSCKVRTNWSKKSMF